MIFMTIVIKIGGSSLASAPELLDVIKDFLGKEKIGIVVGGGAENQRAVDDAKAKGMTNQFKLDLIGIDITRKNAAKVVEMLGLDQSSIPITVQDATKILDEKGVVVMGGLIPLLSTNAVAALLAENTEGSFINLTNVDGVYDSNPKIDPAAHKLVSISAKELVSMAAEKDTREARGHFIVDLIAAKTIARSNIPTHIIKADASELRKALSGQVHNGTVVK